MYEIRHYITADGKDIYLDWRRRVRDTKARIAMDRRINRMERGNLGDRRFCRDGVWELRIHVGPGYRVYHAMAGKRIVLLLCGGDKRTQDADMERACAYWRDWKNRGDENERQTP